MMNGLAEGYGIPPLAQKQERAKDGAPGICGFPGLKIQTCDTQLLRLNLPD
jgi:hypothetical protein